MTSNNFSGNSTRGPSVVSPESSLFIPWYIFLVMFASSTTFALNALIEENQARNAVQATEQGNAQLLNPYLQHHVEKEEAMEEDQVPSKVEMPTERIVAPSGGKVGHYKHGKHHHHPQEEGKDAKDRQRDNKTAKKEQHQIDGSLEKITLPPRPSLGLSS